MSKLYIKLKNKSTEFQSYFFMSLETLLGNKSLPIF